MITNNQSVQEVKLISFFDEHFYKIYFPNGKIDYFPSTTTKLSIIDKPGLRRWYASLGEREAKKRANDAADRGSRIHHAAQVMAMGGCVIYQPIQRPNYNSEELLNLKKKYHDLYFLEHQDEMLDVWKIQKFFEKVNPLIIGTETIVYSVKNREAGTIDLVIKIKENCKIEGVNKEPFELEKGIWICDYKTGNLYDEARMQLASYFEMFKEVSELRDQLKGALIIHTGSKSRIGIPGLNVIKLTPEELKIDYADYRHTAAIWERKNKLAMPKLFEFPSMLVLNKEEK